MLQRKPKWVDIQYYLTKPGLLPVAVTAYSVPSSLPLPPSPLTPPCLLFCQPPVITSYFMVTDKDFTTGFPSILESTDSIGISLLYSRIYFYPRHNNFITWSMKLRSPSPSPVQVGVGSWSRSRSFPVTHLLSLHCILHHQPSLRWCFYPDGRRATAALAGVPSRAGGPLTTSQHTGRGPYSGGSQGATSMQVAYSQAKLWNRNRWHFRNYVLLQCAFIEVFFLYLSVCI